jgi:hypothetical protein
MNSFPEWWVVISGVFFALNIVLFLVLIFAAIKIVGVIQGLQPKVNELTAKVSGIADKVDQLTEQTKTTVNEVGGRAKNVATSVESIAHTASVQFEKFSPLLIGGLTALKLMAAVREYKKGGAAPAPQHSDEE